MDRDEIFEATQALRDLRISVRQSGTAEPGDEFSGEVEQLLLAKIAVDVAAIRRHLERD